MIVFIPHPELGFLLIKKIFLGQCRQPSLAKAMLNGATLVPLEPSAQRKVRKFTEVFARSWNWLITEGE